MSATSGRGHLAGDERVAQVEAQSPAAAARRRLGLALRSPTPGRGGSLEWPGYGTEQNSGADCNHKVTVGHDRRK